MKQTEFIPFEMKRLRYLLGVEGREVCLVETNDGSFNLVITTHQSTLLLYAQRERPRAFKSLTRAADLLKRYGALAFRVEMKEVSVSGARKEPMPETDIPF